MGPGSGTSDPRGVSWQDGGVFDKNRGFLGVLGGFRKFGGGEIFFF